MQPTKPAGSIPGGLSKSASCVNCVGNPKYVFDNLMLCSDCYGHIQFLLNKCKRELAMTYEVYKSTLRSAAVAKRLLLEKGKSNAQATKATTVQSKM